MHLEAAWLIPLGAALVGLCAAALAAYINSNAASVIAARKRVLAHFQAAREQIGRLQSSRSAISFEGYPGLRPDQIAEISWQYYQIFFKRYADETFATRAVLAGLNTDNAIVRRIVDRVAAVIEPDEVHGLYGALDELEEAALKRLARWWLPAPKIATKSRPSGTG